jgi:hypothetical protein
MQAPELRELRFRIWIVELEVYLADLILFRRQVRGNLQKCLRQRSLQHPLLKMPHTFSATHMAQERRQLLVIDSCHCHVLVLTRTARVNWGLAAPPPGQQGWQWLAPVELVQLRSVQAREGLDTRHQYAESESDRTDVDGEAADD